MPIVIHIHWHATLVPGTYSNMASLGDGGYYPSAQFACRCGHRKWKWHEPTASELQGKPKT